MSAPAFDATALTRLRRVSELAVSPCGRFAVVSAQRLDDDESRYVSDLWRVSLEAPGAPPIRLTRGDADDKAPRFRRDGALAFLSNRSAPGARPADGDDERFQIWLLGPDGGDPVRLTDEPLGVGDFLFAREGDRLIAIADVLPGVEPDQQRERAAELRTKGPTGLHYRTMPVRHWDHWRPLETPHVFAYTEEGDGRRDLTPEADYEHRPSEWGVQYDVSADGGTVVVVKLSPGPDRMDDAAIRVIDARAGTHRDIAVEEKTEHYDLHLSPDGAAVACVRAGRPDGRPGKPDLWLFDLSSGEGRPVAPEWDTWPSLHGWTPDGTALLATADWRGHHPLFRVAVESGEVTRLTAEEAGGAHGAIAVAPETEMVVGIRHRMHHPPEPFRMPLEPGATPELVASLSGFTEAEGAAIARWESITVEGDGGDPVQSFVMTPEGASGPRPTLLWIHGGPMGQHADSWHWRWNPLIPAAAGYVVALPNPRGSTGCGQPFIDGIWNNTWGGACYRDLMAVADAIEERDDVDAARIGAMGGSFGGYMTNWIGGQTDRFQCLISHAGLYDLSAFYGTTDFPAFCLWENGFSPYEKPEEYDKYSPHKYVTEWKSPTLVIHGEKDYRVPVSEALMLFEALQLHGVESELLVFPDENHWILKPRNARQWYETFLEFAGRYLQS